MHLGKRFLFGIVAIVCVTIVTIWRNYPPEAYISLVTAIIAIYTVSQTATDSHKNGGTK